jgi:threonine dehydratase
LKLPARVYVPLISNPAKIELEQQAPALDAVLAPVGGGGLIAGIAAWFPSRSVT